MPKLRFGLLKKIYSSEHFIPLSLIVIISACYHIFLIFQFPGFNNDDYYVYYTVSHAPHPFCLNPQEEFFMFVKPTTYFYFWITNAIIGNNPFWLKIFNLWAINSLIIAIYGFTVSIKKYFNYKIEISAIFFACLFFASHPDTVWSVVWLSNINEILVTLFYGISLIFLLKSRNLYPALILSFTFFFVSALFKQHALHYPFLVVLLLIWRRKTLSDNEKKNLIVIIVLSGLVVIGHAIINYLYFIRLSDLSLMENLWKKPFSITGTIFYLVLPLFGETVYYFFITHNSFVLVIVIGALLLIIFYLLNNRAEIRKFRFKPILYLLILTVVIFIPRIFLPAGSRINVIQLFWLIPALCFIPLSRRSLITLLIFLISLNIIADRHMIKTLGQFNSRLIDAASAFDRIIQTNKGKYYIVACPYMKMIPYIAVCSDSEILRESDRIIYSPIKVGTLDFNTSKFPGIAITASGSVITESIIGDDPGKTFLRPEFMPSDSIVSKKPDSIRGYSSISFIPKYSLTDSTISFIWYDGFSWKKLQRNNWLSILLQVRKDISISIWSEYYGTKSIESKK